MRLQVRWDWAVQCWQCWVQDHAGGCATGWSPLSVRVPVYLLWGCIPDSAHIWVGFCRCLATRVLPVGVEGRCSPASSACKLVQGVSQFAGVPVLLRWGLWLQCTHVQQKSLKGGEMGGAFMPSVPIQLYVRIGSSSRFVIPSLTSSLLELLHLPPPILCLWLVLHVA